MKVYHGMLRRMVLKALSPPKGATMEEKVARLQKLNKNLLGATPGENSIAVFGKRGRAGYCVIHRDGRNY